MVDTWLYTALGPNISITAIAVLATFTAVLSAFRLVARAREGTVDRRLGWIFLAAIVGGSGWWGGDALLIAAAGNAAGIDPGLLITSLFVSFAFSLLFMLSAANSTGILGAAVAGLIAGTGILAIAVIGVLAQWDGYGVAFHGYGLALGFTIAAVCGGLAAAIAGSSDREGGSGLAALAVAVGVITAGRLAIVGSTAEVHELATDGLGLGVVAILVAIVMFLVIASGMAIEVIDRDGQYASQRRLRQLADASVEGIVILAANRVVEVNESFLKSIGRPREQVIGETFLGNLLLCDLPEDAPPHSLLWEGQIVGNGDRRVPVEVVARPFDYDDRPHTVFAVRDLSDRRDAELRIRFLAEHDTLTGLPNRASFQRELDQLVRSLADADQRFALYCIDLDRFKEANDVFGHLAGDEILREAGRRLREVVGPQAFVARLGGDEFVAIVTGLPSPRLVGDLADEIVGAFAKSFQYLGQRITIGASVGIALAPNDGTTAELLLARADMALYRAKNNGRGHFCFFEVSMDEETRMRRALAFDLRDAIVRNQFELYYQPLADVSSQEVVGFEALVRWHHPVHGTISPTVFIGIAEESGFITQLGAWVLQNACVEAAAWPKHLKVAVNLSPLQLEQINLPEMVHEQLMKSGLPAWRLELEVTESALMRNPQRALDVLRRIKALGVSISMDDFGTGYSSLATLQSFPFDKLKIDRSFIDRLGTNAQASSIVRAVVGLSRSLEIRVLAEGVETAGQWAFIAGESCDEAQGYMIGRPAPIADYAHLLQPLRAGAARQAIQLRAVS